MSIHLTLLFLLASWVSYTEALCVLTTSLCDPTWASGSNQTFTYVIVGQPQNTNQVQINSYWGGGNYACLGAVNTTSLELSQNNCYSSTNSYWTYGPGDISTFVYFQHQNTGLCLTYPGAGLLTLQPCQAPNYPDSQLWIEPPTTSDPYRRILSKYQYYPNPSEWECMTRVNPNDPQNQLPCQ